MRIVRTGRRDAEKAILFLNPMCADTTFWKNIVSDRLASTYEILMVDYPGYNSAFVSQATLSDMAESVKREILDGMDKPVHLCGYSYGGIVLQEILKKGVKDLRSVVLISCPNRMTPYDKEVNRLLDTLLAEDEMAFCRLLMLLSYRPEFVNENPLFYLTVYAKIQAAGVKSAMLQQLRQMIAMDTVDFELKGIKAMCVFGENDRLLRSDTLSRFQERIDGLRAEIIPGASHMLPEGELGKRLNHFYL